MLLSAGAPARTAERRLVLTLWCAGLAAFAAMYAPQGLLPSIGHDLGVSASQAALLISASTFGLALSVLPWAWLAGRIGLPTAMRTAAVAAAVCAVAVPLLPTFDALLAGRVVHGVALGGIPALAMTLSHDIAAPARAATMAGSYVAATSVGGLGGRLLAVPAAEQFGWRIGLLLLGGVVAALMVAMIALVPSCAATTPRRAAGMIGAHLRNRALWPVLVVGLLLSGAVMTVFNYLPFRLSAAPYGLAPAMISMIFLTYLGGTAGSRSTGWLGARFGPAVVLATAGALVAVGALVTAAGPLVVVVIGVAVLTAGFFAGHAVASSMVAARAVEGRAQASALYTIGYYTGSSLFGWLGGLVWSHGHWAAVATLVAVLGVSAVAFTAAAR